MSSKRKIIMPTDEEDAATNRGIAADPDTYELTDEEFRQMRPAREALPPLIGKKAAEQLLRRRGRPLGSGTKVQLTARFDKDIVDAFKATGDGWQTRMNDALREWMKTHVLA